jgi:SNF2 family DNA or RNA helicase
MVVAPKNAFVAWELELPACAPCSGLSFVRLTGGLARIRTTLASRPGAVVISYQQLPNVIDAVTHYLASNDVFLVLDESHRMKRGTAGIQGAAILRLSHLATRKLVMSGTPVPNAPDDLVPQFTFLYPEQPVTSSSVVERFRSVFVRTTKSELGLEMPVRVVRHVPMASAHSRLYAALASDAGRRLHGMNAGDRIQLRAIARCVMHLLQAASNPALLCGSSLMGHPLLTQAVEEGVPAKLAYACDLARRWAGDGHKVVIWSTFVATVEHVAGLLLDVGAHFIHGQVETSGDPDAFDTREAKLRDFNDPRSRCMVLVANPAACSEGISLHHVCHRAIYVDRSYNAAHYLQSEDRIHRIGLAADVQTLVTILETPGTIDESVARRLSAKVAMMQQILDDPDLSIKPLDLDADEGDGDLDADDITDLRALLAVQ